MLGRREHMALIRGAVITGFAHGDLEKKIGNLPRQNYENTPAMPDRLSPMRAKCGGRIAKHHPPRSKHDLRLIPGGLIDLDFFTQVMQFNLSIKRRCAHRASLRRHLIPRRARYYQSRGRADIDRISTGFHTPQSNDAPDYDAKFTNKKPPHSCRNR